MKLKRKHTLILLGIGWLISIVTSFEIGYLLTGLEHTFKPITESKSIKISGKNEFFLNKHIWGLLGNHHVIYLTKDPNRKAPDEEKDMIFRNTETVFVQVYSDSIVVFTRQGDEVKNIFNDHRIHIKRLENPDFMNLYDEYHAQLICSDWL